MSGCFLILGIPRSGTSIMGRLLHLSGISMGERLAEIADENWNAKGFYEDTASEEIVTRIRTGLRIENGRIAWADLQAVEDYKTYIRRRCLEGVWGLKQYHLPIFLADFCDWCPCPVTAIVMRRNFFESTASLVTRTGLPATEIGISEAIRVYSQDLWWLDQSLISFTGRVLEVDFQSLIQHPYTVVEGLCRFLNRPFSAALVEEVQPKSKRLGPRERPANRYRIDTTPTAPSQPPAEEM